MFKQPRKFEYQSSGLFSKIISIQYDSYYYMKDICKKIAFNRYLIPP